MAQIIGFRACLFDPRLLTCALCLKAADVRKCATHCGGLGHQAAEGIDQLAMRARIDKGAIVVLPMDFDEFAGDHAQGLRGHPLIVDECAAAAIRELHPAQNEDAIGIDILRLRRRKCGMTGG